jgi:hypothetical protein
MTDSARSEMTYSNRHGGGRPKPVEVIFVAKADGAYELWQDSHRKRELTFNKDNDDISADRMRKVDHYLIDFRLHDKTGRNLRFAPKLEDAMWVATGTADCAPECPQSPCYSKEFFAVDLRDNGKSLIVCNEDQTPALLRWSFRFLPHGADPSNPKNYVEYDPIIRNQNGGVA